MFYPVARYITKVVKGTTTVITFSVKHGYNVGEELRFKVPSVYGMTELDGLSGTVTAIDTTLASGNTVTVNINSSTFSAFAFPLTADTPFSPAMAAPAGENTAVALELNVPILSSAYVNTGFIGMSLAGGAGNPGGASNDIIEWVSGTSFSVNNE